MKSIEASEFEARCLRLIDEVAESGEGLVITKDGRPVSKLLPYRELPKSPFGLHAGDTELLGDVVEPTGQRWKAEPSIACCVASREAHPGQDLPTSKRTPR
ncbi:MAG: type II toxin-antitoxin system prevent-host-death family antitoxin [Acidobacteria bacterium]|nr:MAG: type II toxin-antitoxin system prevent-host-death family antitoxin [Acidobacteriota bacterium]REK06103.1 MAG: type II toxin-antitoxin system prevent-host-death family antitoxin [Acidobacteriota bacterium]